jgi:dihydroorotase
MRFDLVLKNGTVIDPAQAIHERLDVGFKDGLVAALEPTLPEGSAAEVVDVQGLLVTPGLVDVHAHFFYGLVSMAVDPRTAFLPSGVTAAVDAGTSGAANFTNFRDFILEPSPLHLYGFLNVGVIGFAAGPSLMLAPGTTMLDVAQPDKAIRIIDRNRDRLVGVKLMLPGEGSRFYEQSQELLERTVMVAEQTGTRVMCHIDGGLGLDVVLRMLRTGDVVTHCFQGREPTLVGADGHIRPEVDAARAKGVLFDMAPADRHHISWPVVRAAASDGFFPDVIATDMAVPFRGDPPMASLPECISMMVGAGMDLDAALGAATSQAAAAIGRADVHGSLAVGRAGDAAVLETIRGSHRFRGMLENDDHTVEERFAATATVLAGKLAWTATADQVPSASAGGPGVGRGGAG